MRGAIGYYEGVFMNHLNICIIEGNVNSNINKQEGYHLFHVKYKLKDEQNEIAVRVYGSQGDTCAKYLNVGSHVLISGIMKSEGMLSYLEGKDVRFLPSETK